MKKVTVACAILAMLMFSSVLFAGEVGEIHYGVKGGIGLAKAWGDDVPDEAAFKLGANVGAFMNYRVHEMFVVQPEVFYAMKGWKLDEEGSDEISVKMDYIDIDVLAKLTIPMESMIKPSIFVGPYVGINMTADWEVGDESEAIDNAKSTDFGLVLGGGVDYEMENGMMILLDIRYSMGLTNIFEVPEGEEGEEPAVKNNSIIFMAGVAF
ncbi:MAG TPA: porin family protein [Patescibacteria group bacterium]|nr:porin family protein [Patescibacteria group bacterium]